ncbi:MAG TPA: sigma-70 family RNA polymerase sigma factor, partial [Bryobacteraceae bacterium]|nr:sigma-70 family RNA polymerase sigma factor [Bryobacteraceae bacterium]
QTSFAAWMYGIARNALIDQLRKRRPETAWSDDMPEMRSPEALPDERVRTRQEAAMVQQALRELPADKREVLILSRYQNLRYDEIGRILGCEPNTVKQRVFRAVRALTEKYGEIAGGLQ